MNRSVRGTLAERSAARGRERFVWLVNLLLLLHAALRWRWIAGVARRLAGWRPGRSR